MLRPSTSFMDLPQPTGIAVPWCTADAVYGRDRKLREYCKQHTIGCALGVPCSFRVTLPSRAKVRVDATLEILTSHSWQIASCGAGLQRRPSLRLRLAGHRWSAPLPAHPPQLDQPSRGGVLLLLRPRTRPGHPRRARRGVWTTLDRRRRPRIRQGPVRIRTQHHRPTSDSSHRPWSRSNACSTCSPAPGGPPSTTCTGRSGDAATKPALAGTTIEPGSHDQLTRYRCPARRRVAGRRRGRGDATAAAGGLV
jgi:hypothetical protein